MSMHRRRDCITNCKVPHIIISPLHLQLFEHIPTYITPALYIIVIGDRTPRTRPTFHILPAGVSGGHCQDMIVRAYHHRIPPTRSKRMFQNMMAIAARVLTQMKLDAASNAVPLLLLPVFVAAALDDAELGAVLVAAVPDAEVVVSLLETLALLVVCVEAFDAVLVVTKLVS